MFDFLGRLAANHPRKVCLAWVVAAVALTLVAPNWQTQSQDDDIRFLPESYPSVRAYHLLEQAFPRDVCASRAIFAVERPDAPLNRDDFALVDRLVARLNALRTEEPNLQITGVYSYRDGPVGSRLTSTDKRCTLVQLALATPYLAVQTRTTVDRAEAELRPILVEAGDAAPKMFVTGPAGIGRDLVRASAESLDHTTVATVVLVVTVLLLVYRSPILALIPLVTIGMAVWVALQLLALVTLIPGVHLVNVSQVFAVVILFGAGTDYCLFLISRYREELQHGQAGPGGLLRAVRAVGGALAASAGTVMCGLGMMGFAEFGKIRCAGPVIALGLAVGLLASLTLTPALLRLGGRVAFWPRVPRLVTPAKAVGGFWNAVSTFVARRPGVVLAVALLPLIPLAIVGSRVTASFRPIGDLCPTADSVRGLEAIQAHFTAGETGPLTVLLAARADWASPAGRDLVTHLSQGFGHLPNVAEVRSLVQPLGKPLAAVPKPAERPAAPAGLSRWKGALHSFQRNLDQAVQDVTRQMAEQHYLARTEDEQGPLYVTRIDVVFRSDPFDAHSVETLDLIETWTHELLPRRAEAVGHVQAECFGVTVHTRDLARVVARDRALVNALVIGGVFLILLVVVRRVWMAGYLLGTVLLSYYATLGLTALFASWLSGRPMGEIEWRVPFFLFTILVAVGEDYNILLITRILQERKRHGLAEGTRRGLATTGGTITACGLIMAGTFGTLMLADLNTLKQIGFALGVGVLLDTFLIRPFVVPAFLLLVWREEDEPKPEPAARPVRRPVYVPPLRRAG